MEELLWLAEKANDEMQVKQKNYQTATLRLLMHIIIFLQEIISSIKLIMLRARNKLIIFLMVEKRLI